MSLTYNCSLFTQAGLDPTKPPTTWDEVRAAAKTIAEKTGVAGYAEMATENTGGWQLTTSTYALGGRMETVGDDGKVTATVNNDATKAGPRAPQGHALGRQLAWARRSTTRGARSTRRSPSGQIGMFTGGSDLYTAMVQNNGIKPEDYCVTTIPLEGDRRRRPRRRHPRGGQRRHQRGRARRRGQLDRLLLHAEAADPGRRGRRRRGPQGQQPAGRRARPADLRQGDLRPVAGVDQGLHQRPDRPDGPVHLARSSTSRS